MDSRNGGGVSGVTGHPVMDAILVNYDALDWTVGYCRRIREGMRLDDMEGWLLCRGYMEVLGLDVAPILQDLSRPSGRDAWNEIPPLDFWRRAIRKVGCRLPDGRLEFCRPGMNIPSAFGVDQILFTPDPSLIPYSNIIEALRRAGEANGIRLRDLLFQFNGRFIRNATALADTVLNRNMEPHRVCEALDRWRDGLADRIATGTIRREEPEEKPESVEEKNASVEGDPDFHVPDIFRGKQIFATKLAQYIGRECKTLRRWDRAGMVPTGKKWHPGTKMGGNMVVYDLGANWPAIQSMMRRHRDERTDKQLAQELGALAADTGTWSGREEDE